MNVSVILGHPNKESFNHALYTRVIGTLKQIGHHIFAHDLYREGFNPVIPGHELAADATVSPPIKKYCRELARSGGVVFIHPNWWGQLPAILKGYIDRVFRPGVAYEFIEGDSGGGVPRGLLKGKTAIVFTTSNTARKREKTFFGDPLDLICENCIFRFCGIQNYCHKNFGIIADSTLRQRIKWLLDAANIVRRRFPKEY